MLPLLQPGDEVLVDPRAYRRDDPCQGDIVILRHPQHADLRIVKRITAVFPDQTCTIAGDNAAASTDSRVFGAVPISQIEGRVTSRFG